MARQSDGEIQSWRRKMRCTVLSGSPKVVSGGQRLNGMEKRCDWLITVMEHIATTIGLFSPSTHQHHPPTVPLCTHRISVDHCTVNCRGVYKSVRMQIKSNSGQKSFCCSLEQYWRLTYIYTIFFNNSRKKSMFYFEM